MKKLVLIISILLSSGLFAQNFDSIMKKPIVLNCEDVTANSSYLFSHYLDNNQIDSAKLILEYWESKCGLTEPTFRANVLLNLVQGNSIESLIDSYSINFILKYKERRHFSKANMLLNYDNYKSYYGYLPFQSRFDQKTLLIASEKINSTNPESIDYLFCELYADLNDSILIKVQEKAYENTSLRREYNSIVESLKPNPSMYMGLLFGAWVPTGSMKKIGVLPSFGMEVGADIGKMSYGLNMVYKGDKSKEVYLARNKETKQIDSTNYFSSASIGFDVGRLIFQTRRSNFRAQFGIGLDVLTVFEDKNKEDDINSGTSIYSYNFNFGLNYRFYISDNFYIGAIAKYNSVDYKLGNIINFTANPITFHITFGMFANDMYNRNILDRLNYKGKYR